MKIKNKYKIWDRGVLVPAWTRFVNVKGIKKLSPVTIQERKIGLRYYLPANAEEIKK